MKRRRILLGVVTIFIVVVSIVAVVSASRSRPVVRDGDIPVATAKVGDLDVKVHATGELRAAHSMMLTAPPIGEGALQITHLVPTGTTVKKDQVLLEFDPSEQQYKVEQSRSELLQAAEEITKARADAAVQAAQDKVALLKARFDVRRAQLEVEKNELVSTIDAKKNDLALDQAKRALAQLQQDIQSHTASGQATIDLALEKRHKAQLEMTQAQQNIEKMRVRSPMDGVLAIEKNLDSAGDMFWEGMSIPDYHEGDQAHPGANIARVLDPSEMEIGAKLDERERGSVRAGQAVEIQFDALPDQVFRGTLKSVAGIAIRNFWEDVTGGRFEVTIQLLQTDPRLRAGFTAQIVVVGDAKKNVTYVPRLAVFLKDGQRVVYVKDGNSFEAHQVKIGAESETRCAVEGLTPGTEVALLDPTVSRKSSQPASVGPSVGGR